MRVVTIKNKILKSPDRNPVASKGSHEDMARPSWLDYFMGIAHLVATRSTCCRRHVGAILVKDRHILASGYNGVPSGITHCEKVGCLREEKGIPSGERHELCRGLHAEQNAIIQAALYGISIKGATLYSTHLPCIVCAKMLINAQIREIIYEEGYPDPLALKMLEESGVLLVKTDASILKSDQQ